ncbi:hypothetical protein BDZ89DRAFT_1141407 [Hymenopellis radicata]|nr:hypothetical protein BDZ89DRAFT_1141407 [Hymenopellis radicata]
MTDYHADTTAVLPGFSPAQRDDLYAELHQCLWRTASSPSQPADSAGPEPKRLAEFIEACYGDGDATAMDVDDSEQPPPAPAPPIRYIDLKKNEGLAVGKMRFVNKLIVREEYVEFMTDASAIASKGQRANFFLTGQPGIGKQERRCRLLPFPIARFPPVGLLPSVQSTLVYFSEAGVEVINMPIPSLYVNTARLLNAIRRSWVIVDVDASFDWLPPFLFKAAQCLVWTSSPTRERRMHRFIKHFSATAWYMKPWSSEEIAAVTTLENRDPKDVQDRLKMCGPVAWSLFSDSYKSRLHAAAIDQVVEQAVAGNIFDFATSSVVDQVQASHRMFLVRPLEVIDRDGQSSLERGLCSFNFISNYVASRTAEQMEQHIEKVRQQLARAFNSPNMRSAAGKLVESMLHRALIHRKIHVPAIFGGGLVKGELELIGQAKDFLLETHVQEQRTCRPLYLRPQTSDFAAVDAILVTADILTRLKTNKIEVDLLRLVYCIVGTDEDRVKKLVCKASEKLTALQANPQARELGDTSKLACTRLNKLEVKGFMVDMQKGLVPYQSRVLLICIACTKIQTK